MSISLTIVTSFLKVCNSLQMSNDLDDIYIVLNSIYVDISEVHYRTAREALHASIYSSDPMSEIRIAKSNLVTSYEIAKKIPCIMVKHRFLFIPFKENLLKDEDKRKYYLNIAKLAAYISILYKLLNEDKNSSDWHIIAFKQFDIFLQNMSFNYGELEELYKTAPQYVHYSSDSEIVTPPVGDYFIDLSSESYRLTKEGLEFEKQLKNELLNKFKKEIEQGFIIFQ